MSGKEDDTDAPFAMSPAQLTLDLAQCEGRILPGDCLGALAGMPDDSAEAPELVGHCRARAATEVAP